MLSEEAFGLFTKAAINSPYRGEPASYGYGVWVSDIEGHTRLRHTGGMVAFSSSLDVDLTDGVGAFASVNANLRGYRPVAVTKYAIELFNASLANKTLPEAPAAAQPADEVKNAEDYAGVYTSPDGKKLEFTSEGEKLMLSPGKHTIRFDFKYDGLGGATLAYNDMSGIGQSGTGVLSVDGKAAVRSAPKTGT